jgi:hypothetical protein
MTDNERLASVETKIDNLTATTDRIEAQVAKVTDDHEQRLRELEASDRRWAAVVMLASACVSAVMAGSAVVVSFVIVMIARLI